MIGCTYLDGPAIAVSPSPGTVHTPAAVFYFKLKFCTVSSLTEPGDFLLTRCLLANASDCIIMRYSVISLVRLFEHEKPA